MGNIINKEIHVLNFTNVKFLLKKSDYYDSHPKKLTIEVDHLGDKLIYTYNDLLGAGSYGWVYSFIEQNTKHLIAILKTMLRVVRPVEPVTWAKTIITIHSCTIKAFFRQYFSQARK